MSATRFETLFSRASEASNATPGRVNLIGEHIDYNGGLVAPAAIRLGVVTHLAPRKDKLLRIASDRFDGVYEGDGDGAPQWAAHAVGALYFAREAGMLSAGADLFIASTIPDGAGLSSSAALIVSILKSARDLARGSMSDVEIALLARRVENEFIGVPCGIMDQMAVALARPGEALALDTKSLRYEIAPLFSDARFIVVHSGVQRRLAEGRYAERRNECEEARRAIGAEYLCLPDPQQQARIGALSGAPLRRARHCVSEHRRSLAAVAALKAGDSVRFGALMNESHISMRDDFEMSLPAIDALVADAQAQGALGARLTGGGFGGCIVALVPNRDVARWSHELLARRPDARIVA
jgi:galactokinase